MISPTGMQPWILTKRLKAVPQLRSMQLPGRRPRYLQVSWSLVSTIMGYQEIAPNPTMAASLSHPALLHTRRPKAFWRQLHLRWVAL